MESKRVFFVAQVTCSFSGGWQPRVLRTENIYKISMGGEEVYISSGGVKHFWEFLSVHP